MISRLCLINPFSLRILISRRVCCMKDLTYTSSPRSSSLNYPPYLWITIKQESCVVHLSNTKISDLLSCIKASQCQLNRIKPMKWKYSSMMKKFSRIRNHSISFSDSNVHSNCNTFKQRSHHTSISVSQCCHWRDCCGEKSADNFSSPAIFDFKRKKLIATYSIQSFIIQFESKGLVILIIIIIIINALFQWLALRWILILVGQSLKNDRIQQDREKKKSIINNTR